MVAEWISCLEKRPADRTGEDLDIVYAKLKDSKAFERFHPTVLLQICYYGYYQDLEGGITLFRQGDTGCYWYAVLTGAVDVNVAQTGKMEDGETICTLGPGKVFGESVLDDTPRNATVVTAMFCELILVEKKDFRTIWERNKHLLEGIISHPSRCNSMNGMQDDPQTQDEGATELDCAAIWNPSETLMQAGLVLRYRMLLHNSPILIRNRKCGDCVHKMSFFGTEAVNWLTSTTPLVHGRFHAVAMLQALLEEGVIAHVFHEHEFKDKDLLYRFAVDESGCKEPERQQNYTEEDLDDVLLMLSKTGPDAQLRMALRKHSQDRSQDDLDLIYHELLQIKVLQHFSTMVKKELASAFVFDCYNKKGTVVFKQGEPGTSWYIILKGSVNVVVHGKGVVCQMNEGDDFGKLAVVNETMRSATIETSEDFCHFLRVGKDDFNRIFKDVEANTVRLKEHGKDVLVLEKMNIHNTFGQSGARNPQKYSVMAGTPEKMVEYLLETRIDNTSNFDDDFLSDFLVAFPIIMSSEALCQKLLSDYDRANSFKGGLDENSNATSDHLMAIKKRVVQVTLHWCYLAQNLVLDDKDIYTFIKKLLKRLEADGLHDELNLLKTTILRIHARFTREGITESLLAAHKFNLSRYGGLCNITDSNCKLDQRPISGQDQNIFRVFCADHTYTTLALPYKASAQTIVAAAKERILLGDDCVLCEVKSSGERVPFKSHEIGVTTGLSVNGRLFIAPREHLDSLTPTPEQEGPSCNSFAFLETMSSKELAYYISQYDYELFSLVNVYEFIFHVFGKHVFNHITPNLDVLLQRFNQVQLWVETEILLTQQLNKRASLLKKFIKLAAHCKEYNNWYTFFAIVMGLNSVAVSRLSQTWEKLPGKLRNIYQEFENTLEPSRNHRVYRLSVGKMKPPILPFMPLLMKDMTFTNEGNKTQFGDLVNFEKMRIISATIRLVQYCRSEPFSADPPSQVKPVEGIFAFVRNFHVIDNQRTLTQLSHRLEPRKSLWRKE